MTDWYDRGYSDGMKLCLNIPHTKQYPLRDTHSAENEADYLAGFNGAIHDWQMSSSDANDAFFCDRPRVQLQIKLCE